MKMESFENDEKNDNNPLTQDISPAVSDSSIISPSNHVEASASFRGKLDGFSYKSPKALIPTIKRESSGIANGGSLRRSARKREIEEFQGDESAASIPNKKKKRTAKERSAADPYDPENNLIDSLRPGLKLVFIGLNPGLQTAATGHAYAHPSNMFWKLLHWSGITVTRHDPSETHALMDLYSIGNTNICKRPTRTGAGLSKEEMIEGASILEKKIGIMKPEVVCIVGKGIWDTIYKFKTGKTLKASEFRYGWQSEEFWLGRTIRADNSVEWQGSRTFVASSTSGLAAGLNPEQKLDIWRPLGQWMQKNPVNNVKVEN